MAIRQLTREEYEQEFSVKPNVSAPPEQNQGNFATGLAKSGLSILKGSLQLGEKLGGKAIIKGLDKLTGSKGGPLPSEEKYLSDESLKTRGFGEKDGKFVGDVAQFAIPQTKVSKATQALSTIPRIAARMATAGAVGSAQTGELKGGAVAAGVEGVIPGVAKGVGVVAKPVTAFMGRLLKGVSSGLSGASTSQIEAVLKNPKAAQQVVKEIKSSGGANLLRKNSKEIVQGVSEIRKEARKAFGEGVEKLSATDIKPDVFREQVRGVLDKYGVLSYKDFVASGKKKVLKNIEFDDPNNLKRAKDLISRLSKVELDGKSLRKLADDISSSKYKVATSDERLAFNAFVKDLSSGLTNSIKKSTEKLDEINKAFSQDMQIAEEIQQIFGKVKFKNAKEILTVSQRLESLFNKKGLAPESIDRFLKRIGVESTGFRAGEAARQMGELAPVANTVGTSPFEIIRAFTSAIVPPEAVRNFAIRTGIGLEVAQEIATKLSPVVRSTLVRLIIGEPSPEPNNSENK